MSLAASRSLNLESSSICKHPDLCGLAEHRTQQQGLFIMLCQLSREEKTGTSCSKRGRALLPSCPGKGAGAAGVWTAHTHCEQLPSLLPALEQLIIALSGQPWPPEAQGGFSSAALRFREQEPCLFLADLLENRILGCCEPEPGCLRGQTWEPGNERQSCSQTHLCKHFLPVLIINLLSLFVPCSTLMFLTRAAFFRSHGGFCKRLCHDRDHFIDFYSSHQLLQLLKRCHKGQEH